MIYLIDANILITAARDYYALDQVPEFWDWLKYQGEQGAIKMPIEVFDEVMAGTKEKDLLLDWLKSEGVKEALVFDEDVDPSLVQQVVENGYASDLTDSEIEQIGNDPFLIAYALANTAQRTVVTNEQSKPSRKRQNRHVPDVCSDVGVTSATIFAMTKALSFSTSWRRE